MSTTQDFTCVFCSETFEDKESLQEHFRKHGDPKFNSVTKNKSRFENEQSFGSEKSEDNEMVGCDVCDEMFKSISKAITHKHKVHPDHDTKHFCPWCGKLFTMKHLYNKHMQSSHANISNVEETRYHCDSCNVNFFVPSAMVYHNKFFHRQDSELPSIGHSKKVKTFNQEMVQIYYCPFCGDEYNNKVNLHKHMADDHSDENQSPDEVLRCPLCDAIFYHLDAYELHLSFHSSEDIYSDDSDMAMGVTDFSLESVPPIMEKVEEETKNVENEGIDKYLQLIMDETRESGNSDGLDKQKSKKHKKHKKSKKAAITLDEFLNMNKDVFGDGLDVQGIEEVPTQQVLKKCKGKKDNIAKAIPASAIAKLKKQGITVKSNSSPNSPTFQTNRNVTMNKTTQLPNRLSVMGVEKPKVVTTSNELLTKLLNQGNNQIKIVKKSSADNLNKDNLNDPADIQEPASSNIKQAILDNSLSHRSDEEVTNDSNNHEMEEDSSVVQADIKLGDKDTVSRVEYSNETDMEDNETLSSQEHISTTGNNDDNVQGKLLEYDINVPNIEKTDVPKSSLGISDNFQQKQQVADMHVTDNDATFETNGDGIETNVSDEEHVPDATENKYTTNFNKNFEQENYNNLQKRNNKSLDALKHLSGHITIKPTHSVEDKSDVMGTGNLKEPNESEEMDNNMHFKVAKVLGKNIHNISLKNPNVPQKKLDTPTKSIDALKTLNKQLTITPCVTSTTKCNDDDDDLSDGHTFIDNLNMSDKYVSDEKDNANFKTPMSMTKQQVTPAPSHTTIKTAVPMKSVPKGCIKEDDNTNKNTFNMDILKRLTNVTAKPVAKAISPSLQVYNSQPVDPRMSVIQKVEKNKQIDQDIEIFNIEDSDSDQDLSNDESVQKQIENIATSSDFKMNSTNVFKNLSKNITIKATNTQNKNILNIKKEVPSESSKQIIDGDFQSSNNNGSKNISQNKLMNINLDHTLKKLGNNISIKSQFSSPDLHRYQIPHDEDLDDDFDVNDEGSDLENINQVKITEVQEDDEDLPSDADMEYNENVIVQSPHASNSENEEEIRNSRSDEESNDDIEKQIKANTLSKENSATKCLDNFKRNNKELTIKSFNDKNTVLPQPAPPRKKQEETMRVVNKVCKDMSTKQFRAIERQDDDHEILNKNINQSATTSSSNQKVSNQVNTVKTVKTFQSETIIEEITTTVTKTIRTVNQSSKQVAKNASASAIRPRLMVANHQTRPLQGMTVRNAPTVGTKIRNSTPSPRAATVMPTKSVGQLVPVRPQNQIVPRQQSVLRPSAPGPSNIKKMSPQQNIQKPVIGKPLKISPLALNQTVKRAPENVTGHFNNFKRPKDSIIPSMDAFKDDNDDSMVNYSSASSCRSDFSTTATKIVKGKSVVTTTQARSEQHSEQHITKLNNMAGLKIVRTSAKQASQVETKNNMCAAKRTTMDAIEKLQKQGLLVKKPRIEEAPEENEHYNSGSECGEEDYEENE